MVEPANLDPAVTSPAPASNGSALNDVLSRSRPDEDFVADVEAVRKLLDDEAAMG